VIGDAVYFDALTLEHGVELWAHGLSNDTTWFVGDLFNGTGSSNPGRNMSHVSGCTLYFDVTNGPNPSELWAYDTVNTSLWQVTQIFDQASMGATAEGIGGLFSTQVGHTLYFNANDGHTGHELWAHDLMHGHTWQAADLNQGGASMPGQTMSTVVGDRIYLSANDGIHGAELWAHSTDNGSTWLVQDLFTGANGSYPGAYFEVLAGDALYFSAITNDAGVELWLMSMEHMVFYG